MGDNRKRFRITGLVISVLVLTAVTAALSCWVVSLREPAKLAAFQELVESLGIAGFAVLLAIQYVQIVVAFIPGGPIQIAAGLLFGFWGGLAICFTGTVAATATIFFLVARYGKKAIRLFVSEDEIEKYRFLRDENKLEKLTMILFFVPGTPKDALVYLFALTKINPRRFLVISTAARAPAVITSLAAGDSIAAGEWGRALWLFIVLTFIAGTGYIIHALINKRMRGSGNGA